MKATEIALQGTPETERPGLRRSDHPQKSNGARCEREKGLASEPLKCVGGANIKYTAHGCAWYNRYSDYYSLPGRIVDRGRFLTGTRDGFVPGFPLNEGLPIHHKIVSIELC